MACGRTEKRLEMFGLRHGPGDDLQCLDCWATFRPKWESVDAQGRRYPGNWYWCENGCNVGKGPEREQP